jgi:dihydrofolate reductase
MAKLIAFTNLSLDGVMQAPAHEDEDPRDGFPYGGWAAPFEAMPEADDLLGEVGAFLFGRWTYESFYAAWTPQKDHPFTIFFNNTPKYVASTTLEEQLVWVNSTLLTGDLTQAVRDIKDEHDKNIVVFGSGMLLQSLMRAHLVDTFLLLIHPVVLGSGRRLFAEGLPKATLSLTDSKTTSKGVIIARYEALQPDAG